MTTTVTGPKRPLPIRPSLRLRNSSPGELSEASWSILADHREAVVEFLRRRCRDEHQAEDLAHDTLLRAARYSDALDRVERPRAWLVQIAANAQRDLVRKESRIQLRPPCDTAFHDVVGSEPVPGEAHSTTYYLVEGRSVGLDELLDRLRDVWHRLDPADRSVLAAYYREGGSTNDAAEAVHVSAGLAKVRLFRARRRLESKLRRRLASA